LTGDEDENVKRMTHSEREKHAKLMDVELLRTFRKGAPIFKFSDRKEFWRFMSHAWSRRRWREGSGSLLYGVILV
jgi:hypothetical protein